MDFQLQNLILALKFGLITWHQYFEILVHGKLSINLPKKEDEKHE